MAFPLLRLNGVLMTIWLLLAMLLIAPVGGVYAQAPSGGAFAQRGEPNIRATLLAQTPTPKAGETVTLAILMTPKPGWHGYWENPGDAGAGMRVAWDEATSSSLPSAAFSAFRYPVPERLLISGLMNHVYEHEYAVLLDVAVPAGLATGTKLAIRAQS